MTWNQALEERWRELEREIDQKQPVVDEWQRLKEEQELLGRIRHLHSDGAPAPHPPQPTASRQTWKAICDARGWRVGRDSAHRVVMRNDPTFHAKVPHECGYDGRIYP